MHMFETMLLRILRENLIDKNDVLLYASDSRASPNVASTSSVSVNLYAKYFFPIAQANREFEFVPGAGIAVTF